MGGFANSVVGGIGKLIRKWIQSPDYVAGVSGWQIAADGTAEFNDGTFRGEVTITAPVTIESATGRIILDPTTAKIRAIALTSGAEINIDPNNINPQINFRSPDNTNGAFINAVAVHPSDADLGLNSGAYIPADGTPRRGRLWFQDSVDSSELAIINFNTQARKGGFARVTSTNGFIGYADDANGKLYFLQFDNAGVANIVANDIRYNGKSQGFAIQYYSSAAIGSVPFGTSETIVLSFASGFVFKQGRMYEIVVHYNVKLGAVNNVFVMRLRKGSTVGGSVITASGNLAGITPTVDYVTTLRAGNYTGADINTTFCLTMIGSTGSNAFTNHQDSGHVRLEIHDIGVAFDYPDEPAISP